MADKPSARIFDKPTMTKRTGDPDKSRYHLVYVKLINGDELLAQYDVGYETNNDNTVIRSLLKQDLVYCCDHWYPVRNILCVRYKGIDSIRHNVKEKRNEENQT